MTEEVLKFKNPPHIKEWYDILDNKRHKKIVIAAPRNHAKSTAVSVNYPLNEIVRDCNIRILIVSNTLDQAELFLREIKGRIERDNNYREYAGDLVPKYPEKWTDREIIIARTNLELKDATISTVGMGGSVLTRRADLIICDDILSPENTRTAEQRKKVKDWFYQVLMPVLDPHGRLIFIGTIWHSDDLLAELLKDPSYDFRRRYQAIISDSDRLDLWEDWVEKLYKDKDEADLFFKKHRDEMYKGVKVLWKERFPYEKLFLLRRENRIAFEKMYQNRVLSEETQEVRQEWIRYYDEMPTEVEIFDKGTGVDLAISKKETADYTAMVSGKLMIMNGKPKIFVLPYPVNERLTFHETIEKARSISKAVGDGDLTTLWVEDIAYQKAAVQEMVRAGLPAKSIKVGTDKRARLRTVAIYIQNGTVVFPRRGCEDLIFQLVGFGSEAHDDLVDAFVYMVQGLMNSFVSEPKVTII